jgi:hypothetical protein
MKVTVDYEKKEISVNDDEVKLSDFLEILKRLIPERDMVYWTLKQRDPVIVNSNPIIIEKWREIPTYPNKPQVWYGTNENTNIEKDFNRVMTYEIRN